MKRDGDFVYQDFLCTTGTLTYPAEPERYAGNAADFVEVRVKPLKSGLGIRLSFNSMLDPQTVATTIGWGTSGTPRELPHGASAVARAKCWSRCTAARVASGD